MSNNSIPPIDRTLSSATTPGLCGPGSNGNEEVLHIIQTSGTEVSQLDCLVSDQDTRLAGGSYPSANMQSVYSTSPSADWAPWNFVIVHKVLVLRIATLSYNHYTKMIIIGHLKLHERT